MNESVAIIYGGAGAEHEISLLSAKWVLRMLRAMGIEPIEILIDRKGDWYLLDGKRSIPTYPVRLDGTGGFRFDEKDIKVSVAFPVLHGNLGEDGSISAALECANIKVVGCGHAASAIALDKILTKSVADGMGIRCAKWIFATKYESEDEIIRRAESEIGYPLFVKPSTLGSSIGAQGASNQSKLREAIRMALKLDERVLIEEQIETEQELECAYLEYGGAEHYAVGAILSGGKSYGFAEKYEGVGDIRATAIPGLDKSTEQKVIEISRALVRRLGIRQLSRIDFFLTKENEIIFNEINTLPGMTESSLFPALTVKMGLAEGEFLGRLIEETV